MNATLTQAAESILYISALVADQPRAIDRLIDYFGGAPETRTIPLGPARVRDARRSGAA